MLISSNKQITFYDISSEFDSLSDSNSYNLISLLNDFFDIREFIPISFYKTYYSSIGRNRKFSLESMLHTFIIKNILNLPTIKLLSSFLSISKELRTFCGFSSIPNKSQFSRFKSTFNNELNDLFHSLVDRTEALTHEVNPFLASILITDTTGFESYVTENNPKFYQTMLRNVKNYVKTLDKDAKKTFNIEKYTQSRMPKVSSSNPDAKLTYLNGHFGYYIKSIISTNGFGLVRDINFYDNNNELDLDMRPQEIKDKYDAKSLIPALDTFFNIHPDFKYKYFLGDSGFDADDNYAYLYEKHNITPIINLNPRNKSSLPQPHINEFGIPTCPNDISLPMVYDGITREKGRADRIKFICPKVKKTKVNKKTAYLLDCENPCTPSKCGRIKNLTVHHNYRFNSSMPRTDLKWRKLYRIRTVCERSISQLKSFIQINSSKVRNSVSLKSDILFAGISQLVSFILIYKTKNFKNPLAIKSLIA